jgi:hypothetical protein
MFDDDEAQTLAFGIPVDPEWQITARQAWARIRLAAIYGPSSLAAHDRARTELVSILHEKLRACGVPRPMAAAWGLVGNADPETFAGKLQPGQPLGDLTPDAVLGQYAPLVLSRLKHFGVAGNKDAKSAARLGLLEALAAYNPAMDASVGTFAVDYRLIDNAIKRAIRNKDSDALDRPGWVSGDQKFEDDEGESTGERWDVTPKLLLSDETAEAIDKAHDKQQRLRAKRIPFPTALWLAEVNPRPEKPFGAREESWMDLPATPQEMADYVLAIPSDNVVSELARLSDLEREILTARFFRDPPVLLDCIARGDLDRNKRRTAVSYHRVVTIAYRAALQIANGLGTGPIKTRPPIRRPMRDPPPLRKLTLHPLGPPDFRFRRIHEEIRLWPLVDGVPQTVYGTRPDSNKRLPAPPLRLSANDIAKIIATNAKKLPEQRRVFGEDISNPEIFFERSIPISS